MASRLAATVWEVRWSRSKGVRTSRSIGVNWWALDFHHMAVVFRQGGEQGTDRDCQWSGGILIHSRTPSNVLVSPRSRPTHLAARASNGASRKTWHASPTCQRAACTTWHASRATRHAASTGRRTSHTGQRTPHADRIPLRRERLARKPGQTMSEITWGIGCSTTYLLGRASVHRCSGKTASEPDLAARRGAKPERSRSYVRVEQRSMAAKDPRVAQRVILSWPPTCSPSWARNWIRN